MWIWTCEPVQPMASNSFLAHGSFSEVNFAIPNDWIADSLEKTLMLRKIEGRRRGWQRVRWWGGIAESMDMSCSKRCEMVKDREAYAAFHGVAKSPTRLGDWTTTNWFVTWKVKVYFDSSPLMDGSGGEYGSIIHSPHQTQPLHLRRQPI